jgi:hypothetical protein
MFYVIILQNKHLDLKKIIQINQEIRKQTEQVAGI